MDFAKKYLLDQDEYRMYSNGSRIPQGYYFGGNTMHFTPRDMARLGYLYMHDGMLDGKQIVPAEWVEESIANLHVTLIIQPGAI